jgi:hypothetical protein
MLLEMVYWLKILDFPIKEIGVDFFDQGFTPAPLPALWRFV